MDDRRYRGQRRHAATHPGRVRTWMLVGVAVAVVGGAWTIVAVRAHSTRTATVRADPTASDGAPVPAPASVEPAPVGSPSASTSAPPSSPAPSPSRTSPSLTPAEFALALSPSSGPVTAGSQLRFTITTSVVAGTPGQLTLAVTGLPADTSYSVDPDSVDAGDTTQVTISTAATTPPGTYPVAVSASARTAHHSATYALTVTGVQALLNGDFESGLANWSATGPASVVDSPVHGGGGAVRLGTTTPSGDTTISQTITATGSGRLSLWYQMVCTDRVAYDWFDAWATDLTTNQTVTLASKTCHTTNTYQQVSATLTVGHRYRVVVENRDDNHSSDASYTFVDDVSLT